ncbi:MAG: caspase family protein, partial [Sphingobacteriales bacterium]
MKISLVFRLRRALLVAAFATIAAAAHAQEQRALVIGIDTYQPPEGVTPDNDGGRIDFSNLDGCKNDAEAIKQLITRYSFSEKNVRELYDRQATRDGILAALNGLLADSKRGDIAFIYYAGHGSQMRNTKSGEKDQRDESMVPSNTWQKGVSDIRDKELALIFNAFIDKGVKLTCIFDCC